MVLAWVIVALVLASLGEYVMHRFPMHRKYLFLTWAQHRHVAKHHTEAFYGEAGTYKFGRSSAIVYVIPIVGLIAAGSSLRIGWGSLGLFLGITVYVAAYEILHYNIHHPTDGWFQHTKIFRLWVEWHRTHHVNPKKNFGVVLGWVWDFPFMTSYTGEIKAPENAPPHLAMFRGVRTVLVTPTP